MITIDTSKIIDLSQSTSTGYLGVLTVEEVFAPTWHCSHLRLIRIDVYPSLDFETILAYCFNRTRVDADYSLEKWLSKRYFIERDNAFLIDELSCARVGIKDLFNKRIQLRFCSLLDSVDIDNVTSVIELSPDKVPNTESTFTPHMYGPTYILCWQETQEIGQVYYFLETHLES